MRRSMSFIPALAVLAVASVTSATATASTPSPSEPTSSTVSGELTVFAAASLTDAFTSLGDAFTAANPDVDITFNFAASSDLVGQINEGAPADVFASADQANMDKLTDGEGTVGDPATFATNTLEIIVEAGNPQGITGLEDLANPDLIVVSCDPAVPIGAYTQQVLDNAGVTVEFDSLEDNVRGIVDKVTSGEADAGVVYATDVIAAGDAAAGVEIPADVNVVADYPIARLGQHAEPRCGRRIRRVRAERRRPGDPRRLRLRSASTTLLVVRIHLSRIDLPRRHIGVTAPAAARRRRAGTTRPPALAIALATVAAAFFALPFVGLLWRVPWSAAWSVLTNGDVGKALWLSIECSLAATALSTLFGVPLAWVLATVAFPGRAFVRALCTLSMVLPPVVGGIALFAAIGRRGLFGQYLDRWFGYTIPFTTTAVVIAQTFVAMPFLVLTVEAAVRQADVRLRRGRPLTRGVALVHVPAGDGADHPPGAHRRGGARVGPRARRVRRDDHVRRQLPRPHADDAARDLPRTRGRPVGGDRAEPGAHPRLVRGDRRPARPVAANRAPRPNGGWRDHGVSVICHFSFTDERKVAYQ